MKKISHSKIKNTGIIFEILVKQLTNEAIYNNENISASIIKKYFNKTEISKENKLYQSLLQYNNLNESKAYSLINTIMELSSKLDKKKLNQEKYNLIKEIKNNYDLDSFFKTDISNYKILASIYTVLESVNENYSNIDNIISSKNTILEHITSPILGEDQIYEELSKLDKGNRFLIYNLMLEKFNSKYKDLNEDQKLILKEYIYNISEEDKLKKFIDTKLKSLKESLNLMINKIEDEVTLIKIKETLNYIDPIIESRKVKEDHLVSLLQYTELNSELSKL